MYVVLQHKVLWSENVSVYIWCKTAEDSPNKKLMSGDQRKEKYNKDPDTRA